MIQYGSDIARILELAGGGTRPMPLVRASCVSTEARDLVRRLPMPDSMRAGLYLYCGCWDEGHTTADAVENPDGYFWHAIAHRQEPDPDNAAYWFRKTGDHPVFPKLAGEAAGIGYQTARAWDPFQFIEFCRTASADSSQGQLAMKVQLLEWRLLLDHCARGPAF